MNSSSFLQTPPRLYNQFSSDLWLQSLLRWRLPKSDWPGVRDDLNRFGDRVVGDMLEWAWQAETEPPQLINFDPWGRRIDEIKMSPAWSKLGDVAAEEGVVALAYERPLAAASRLFQLAKLHLYHPSSGLFSCPLAMTDGAARILELLAPSELKERAFKRLISRDPKKFWTSGQWMTERSGGSDVSGTETVAKREGESFRLYGTKWFTSSVTSQMAMALGRIEGAPMGSKGLSVFYVETRDASGALDHIQVLRLKDKLGTKGLPTAELGLQGVPARLLGEAGQGVKNIATMLNITRLYNSVCAVAHMRRALFLLQDYSKKRQVFAQSLAQQPLFAETYLDHVANYAACLVMTFSAGELLGKEECGVATDQDKSLLRLLTPLVKLFTGKHVVWTTSEAIEGFAGAGYVEDTRLPVLIRDAQVFPIWEGPTNVLSLDLLRVLQKSEALLSYERALQDSLARLKAGPWAEQANAAVRQMKEVAEFLRRAQGEGSESLQSAARGLAFRLSEIYCGVKLLEWAEHERQGGDKDMPALLDEVVKRWWRRSYALPQLPGAEERRLAQRAAEIG